jgi:hypothetical protein
MVTPDLLRVMKRAGLVAINFESRAATTRSCARSGRESPPRVVRALNGRRPRAHHGLQFHARFPQETPEALERTLRFMERIEPLVDSFSTMGVVVPFPGTPIYDDFHTQYGFSNWWLREDYSRYSPSPPIDDFDRFYRHYIDDTNLDLDFFHYSDEMKSLIRACMKFKAEHNLARMGLMKDPVFRSGPTELFQGASV